MVRVKKIRQNKRGQHNKDVKSRKSSLVKEVAKKTKAKTQEEDKKPKGKPEKKPSRRLKIKAKKSAWVVGQKRKREGDSDSDQPPAKRLFNGKIMTEETMYKRSIMIEVDVPDVLCDILKTYMHKLESVEGNGNCTYLFAKFDHEADAKDAIHKEIFVVKGNHVFVRSMRKPSAAVHAFIGVNPKRMLRGSVHNLLKGADIRRVHANCLWVVLDDEESVATALQTPDVLIDKQPATLKAFDKAAWDELFTSMPNPPRVHHKKRNRAKVPKFRV
eukprot:NODE_4835_length_1012_cov_98.962880_g4628_i0.p1 GENE.NODE_4835_length_1012_cov_98.962880_g4628_i0~~NODE_4835_length_1012_cov_98.962880_g4628_i0.p1  ORF type:complete len:273 (+),score=52.15 NODE_4835_length_1012_cov_98.962880_g4628_i0:66-884(+)